jgi:hypothetical protein
VQVALSTRAVALETLRRLLTGDTALGTNPSALEPCTTAEDQQSSCASRVAHPGSRAWDSAAAACMRALLQGCRPLLRSWDTQEKEVEAGVTVVAAAQDLTRVYVVLHGHGIIHAPKAGPGGEDLTYGVTTGAACP